MTFSVENGMEEKGNHLETVKNCFQKGGLKKVMVMAIILEAQKPWMKT